MSGRNRRTFASACSEMLANPSVAFLVLMILGFAVLGAVLWLIGDRYALIFVPLFIALVLAAKPPLSVRAAGLAIACYALFTAAGVRDHLQYKSALWSAVETLRPSVPDSEINGGNGWLQYAHPQQAHHNADGNVDVPCVKCVRPAICDRKRHHRWLGGAADDRLQPVARTCGQDLRAKAHWGRGETEKR